MADLSKEKGQEPFPQGLLLLDLICIGIQGVHVKLNHCQAEMIK